MLVVSYNNLKNKQDFLDFCKTQSLEKNKNASINMWNDDWENKPETLPYLLEKTTRFNDVRGDFFVVYHNNDIVACSGVYISNFHPLIGIAGVRTWVKKEYRHLALNKDFLLAEQKKWCLSNNLKIIMLTFNDYNKNIIQIFKRNRLGELNGRISSREPKHLFYNGLNEITFPVTIQYTKQWAIYEKLDLDWEFDWEGIRYEN